MKKCPYCGNTGADNETYCCKCGNLMYDEPASMQQASNASSYTYNTVNPTDGIGKKKKSKALMIILSIIGIFLMIAIVVTIAIVSFTKSMFIPRSFMNALVDEDYDKVLSYFPDYIAEEQYGDDAEDAFEILKESFEYVCGDDMKITKYSTDMEETLQGSDAEEMNEYYEDDYDNYEDADKFYCYEGTFTVKGDDDEVDCTFEAIVCKIDGKYYLFSINWDED
ncbi:MAG: hypothetical protein IJA10_04620 [Lachnospiraceae bacterium]|nr:hypothetical protein [Lachnospiraceae bacterium]